MSATPIGMGSADCPISKVVSLLKSSTSFSLLHDNWSYLAIDMNTDRVKVKQLRRDYLHGTINLADVIGDIIEDWVGRKGREATLQQFISILEDNELNDAAESLAQAFKIHLGPTPRKYLGIPKGITEFLAKKSTTKSLCLVLTPDVGITCDKLLENVEGCTFHDYDSFIKLMSIPNVDRSKVHFIHMTGLNNLKLVMSQVLGANCEMLRMVVITANDEQVELEKLLDEMREWKEAVTISEDKMEWEELTLAHQQEIRKRLVDSLKVRFEDEQLQTVLRGQPLADLINGKELKLFKQTLPLELSYYVRRSVLPRNCISFRIFQHACPDVFLFSGMTRHELSQFSGNKATDNSSKQSRKETLTVRYMLLDHPNHFSKIYDKTQDLLRYENGKLRWIKTNGGIATVQRFVDESLVEEMEDELYLNMSSESSQQPVCISDSPGMGKSILLAQIGRKLDQTGSGKIVIFIVLRELVQHVKESGTKDKLTLIETYLNTVACENLLGEAILTSKLSGKDTTRDMISVELLLDGYDEVESKDMRLATELLQMMRISWKAVRLWVTSRPHFLEKLEDSLSLLGYNIQPFREEDQVQFLTSYWTRSTDQIVDSDKLTQYAIHCLTSLKEKMDSKDNDIAGIPLQCLLIGEVYEEDALEFGSLDSAPSLVAEIEIGSVTHLYHRLIEKKLGKYRRAYGTPSLTDQQVMKMHARLAVTLLFPESFTKLEGLLPPAEMDELLKVGLLESTSSTTAPRFIHRTFAEFFVAWYLVQRLAEWEDWEEDMTDFFLNVVLERKLYEGLKYFEFIHPVITYFVNYLIPNLPQPAPSRMASNSFRKLIRSQEAMRQIAHACGFSDCFNIFNFFDSINGFGKNAHTVLNREFVILTVKKCSLEFVKLIINHFEMGDQFHFYMQYEALWEAIKRGEFSLVEFLIKEKGLRMIVKRKHEWTTRLVPDSKSSSEIDQRIEILRLLIGINRDRLEEKGKGEATPLFGEFVHPRLMIELIRLGAKYELNFSDMGYYDTVMHLQFGRNKMSCEEYHSIIESIPEEHLRRMVHMKNRYGNSPLLILVKYPQPLFPETVAKFGKLGADFNILDRDGYPPLVAGIHLGKNAASLELLIEHGADINWRGAKGVTVLHIAARHGYAEGVDLFVDKCGMDVNIEDGDGLTPMNHLIMDNTQFGKDTSVGKRFDTGLALQERGGRFKDIVNGKGTSYLHTAVHQWVLDSVKLLVHLGISPNVMDEQGDTPLHYALRHAGHRMSYPIIKFLVDNQGNPNLQNKQGETPLQVGMKGDGMDLETFQLLKSNTDMEWTPFYANLALKQVLRLAANLDDEVLDSLVHEFEDCGGNVKDWKDEEGNSFLHISARDGHQRAARFLHDKRKVVNNLTNTGGQTSLHMAAIGQNKETGLELIKYFIQCGSNLYARDNANFTFLHYYIESKFETKVNLPSPSQFHSIVEYLCQNDSISLPGLDIDRGDAPTILQFAVWKLEVEERTMSMMHSNGLNFNQCDSNCRFPLTYAVMGRRSPESLSHLMMYGADWKVLDNRGRSLIHYAAQFGSSEALQFFIELDELDVNLADAEGDTPLHSAVDQTSREGREEAVKKCRLLMEHGADQNLLNGRGRTPLAVMLKKFEEGDRNKEKLVEVLKLTPPKGKAKGICSPV